jgi:hypothetical protein
MKCHPRRKRGGQKGMDELYDLIKKLKEKKPDLYRHIIGIIKSILATA